LQDVLRRLDKAFENFFRRVKQKEKAGFPRFKGKAFFNSLTYPQSGFTITASRLHLSKIGDIKVKLHRQIPAESGTIKTCTVIREGRHWYCTLSIALPLSVKKQALSNLVGIDVGIENFAVLSNGEKIDNPKYYRKAQGKLSDLQRRYGKSKSNKIKRKISRLHRKTANQRRETFFIRSAMRLLSSMNLLRMKT
jgi:putative transposase